MPHVLLLFEYPTLSGGERSALTTLDAVRGAGFDVSAAAPPHGPLAEALAKRGIPVIPFSADPPCESPDQKDGSSNHSSDRPSDRAEQATRTFRSLSSPRFSLTERRRRLGRLLRECRPDLVHANSLAMGRLSGPVVSDVGVPSVAHLRDIVRLNRAAVGDLNCHTRLIAVSEATRRHHVAGGLVAEKVVVLYNGVDLEEFRPRAASGFLHLQLRLPPDARLIGTIGQIILRKGLDTLLRAAEVVATRHPTAHFLHVGSRFSNKEETRALDQQLQEAARAGALAGRFHLLGPREDVARILNELTLLVHPARQEPLGRVLLEAAASGVAVVATGVGGTAEIFPERDESAGDEPSTAVLVPVDDAETMARAVLRLLEEETERVHLAQAARRRAVAAFDADQAAVALAALYRSVLESGSR